MSIESVVFIHTPCYELEDDRLEPPLGLVYLATCLQKHGYEAQIVDLSSIPATHWQQLVPLADIYGFSTYTASYHRTLEVLAIVKAMAPTAWTVAGGPHASALPEVVSRDFDWVVLNEGEAAIVALVESLNKGCSPPRILDIPPVADLNTLPFADYSLIDVSSYHRVVDGRPSLSIVSSRGCPYRCVFCNSIIMGGHRRIRYRSAANVVDEMLHLESSLGITSFRFQDDLFPFDLDRLEQIAKLLRGRNISYRCFGRVDTCSRRTADLLSMSGCRHISFGVESGSPTILERMKKGQTVEDIRHGIANAHAAGLKVRAYLLVGFPGETWETVQQTIDLMVECQPDEFAAYPVIPYPGTLLFRHPEKLGVLEIDHDYSQYFQIGRDREAGFVFRTETLNPHIIRQMRDLIIDSLEPTITWAGKSAGFR